MLTGNNSQYLLDPLVAPKADWRKDKGTSTFKGVCRNCWGSCQAQTSLKIERGVRNRVAVKINREWWKILFPSLHLKRPHVWSMCSYLKYPHIKRIIRMHSLSSDFFQNNSSGAQVPLGDKSQHRTGTPSITRSNFVPLCSTVTMPLQRHDLLMYDLL